MARTQDPNSADSQFFICLADCDFLTGSYTVWGEVVDGMDAVDALKKAPAGRQSGAVDDPDHLKQATVAADA
jgi:peptidylprolyl isomerase